MQDIARIIGSRAETASARSARYARIHARLLVSSGREHASPIAKKEAMADRKPPRARPTMVGVKGHLSAIRIGTATNVMENTKDPMASTCARMTENGYEVSDRLVSASTVQ